MASVTVKNIPNDLLERLRVTAGRNNRSLNREIIDLLERQLQPYRIDAPEMIRRARELRSRVRAGVKISELSRARREGRP